MLTQSQVRVHENGFIVLKSSIGHDLEPILWHIPTDQGTDREGEVGNERPTFSIEHFGADFLNSFGTAGSGGVVMTLLNRFGICPPLSSSSMGTLPRSFSFWGADIT